jgi:hypothetical protein
MAGPVTGVGCVLTISDDNEDRVLVLMSDLVWLFNRDNPRMTIVVNTKIEKAFLFIGENYRDVNVW